MLHEIRRHVSHIVDTASKLATLAEIVDANQQRFPATRAIGVPKRVALRRAVAKVLRSGRRRRRTSRANGGQCERRQPEGSSLPQSFAARVLLGLG